MTTYDGWRLRRVPDARGRAGAPRTPIDYAKIGRSSVRRRARGMTHGEAVAALETAEQHAHLDRREESAFDDGGRRATELAEWQRVVQLLAATGGPYDPDADVVVQEELAEDRRREEARQRPPGPVRPYRGPAPHPGDTVVTHAREKPRSPG
ncbi:hypothetical protein [Streptomyces sp. NPDC059513]|uniref:hypothetical protein n=1 Tax=unclassified Streptomyces TaxID=2593676 RepID=UPI003697B4D6